MSGCARRNCSSILGIVVCYSHASLPAVCYRILTVRVGAFVLLVAVVADGIASGLASTQRDVKWCSECAQYRRYLPPP